MRIKQSFVISFLASARSSTFVSQCGLSLLFLNANTALSFQPIASLRTPINIQQKFNYNQRLHQTFGAMVMDPNNTDDDERSTPLTLSSLSQLQEVPASTPAPELASIVPGQVLSIRIGDTNLSRKAWKKRRRSNSPILVPCTILGIERQMMVTWNVMNLLHRFGKPLKNVDGRKNGGVVLSTKACARFYKRTLGFSLLDHVQALGYPTIDSFLESTFDEYYYAEYGVQFIHLDNSQQKTNDSNNESSESNTYLSCTLSLRRARESASKACFLQFLSDPTSSSNMLHTGTTVIPNTSNANSRYSSSPPLPLSAAVRLSSMSDLSSDRIWSGMDSRAFVLAYEAKGDNGSPLLVCAIDPPKVQIREATRRRVDVRRKRDWMESERVANDILARRAVKKNAVGKEGGKMRSLEELRVGDGPIRASIVKISAKAGAAFVDLGVERKRGKKHGGGKVRVLGMLRLDDVIGGEGSGLVSGGDGVFVDEEDGIETWSGGDVEEEDDDYNYEEDEEIVDDITDMFSVDDDGNISMTESSSFTSDVTFESDNPSTDDEDDDMFAGIEAEERLKLIEEMLAKEETSPTDDTLESKEIDSAGFLCVGNELDVYIRSVFAQSGRFMVTLDPSIQGRKPKELKRERESKKRLTKLAEKKNEGERLQQILDNVGMECNGTVKAKSKKGNWYYVQPDHVEGLKFPVGVAQTEIEEDLSPGDRVWVRLDGIDESRGQLAVTLLKQIYPDS